MILAFVAVVRRRTVFKCNKSLRQSFSPCGIGDVGWRLGVTQQTRIASMEPMTGIEPAIP